MTRKERGKKRTKEYKKTKIWPLVKSLQTLLPCTQWLSSCWMIFYFLFFFLAILNVSMGGSRVAGLHQVTCKRRTVFLYKWHIYILSRPRKRVSLLPSVSLFLFICNNPLNSGRTTLQRLARRVNNKNEVPQKKMQDFSPQKRRKGGGKVASHSPSVKSLYWWPTHCQVFTLVIVNPTGFSSIRLLSRCREGQGRKADTYKSIDI